MCGFSGFVHYGTPRLDAARRICILKAMGQAIAHRGPDDAQFYDDGVLSLVYRRLSIVDVDGGRQPIFNENESVLIVCNGEIYNHAEVRRSLEHTHRFRTRSDSEVLLHGYEELGQEVLQKVRGMFALALWDRTERRLFLARDRLGIKPLYVCELPGGLLFGSELKALLAHPDCPREVDFHDLSANPISNAITPTYIKGVAHLPAASQLVLEPGRKAQIRPYWSLDGQLGAAPYGSDARRYVLAFDELLEDSVREHLQGESEVGLHLSGGVDSCLVAAIAASQMPGISCHTIVERSNFLAGDVTAAQQVANALGMPWSPVLYDFRNYVRDAAFSLETLEQCSWMMDSPLFDIEWILKRELNRSIRSQKPGLKVLLLGQGADEFAGGYSSRIDARYRNWGTYLKEEVQHFLSVGGANIPLQGGQHSVFLGKRGGNSALSPYHRLMQLMKRQLQHHNLWHEDRTSAAFGMEARVPFLDHRIVELLASVPARLHATLFWNKSIIRQSLQRRLPDYDIRRPKVSFCWTDDSRSLDMLIENMALKTCDAYRDKYVSDKDFAFSRLETDRLIQHIRSRQPGFKAAGVQLLEQMSASIFRHNVQHAAKVMQAQSCNFEPSRLHIIANDEWHSVAQRFERQPYMPFAWLPDHCPRIPHGCSIGSRTSDKGRIHYQLVQNGTVHTEITCATSDKATQMLVQGLQNPDMQDHVVRDWRARLELSEPQVEALLSVLLQSGFIATPETPRRKRIRDKLSAYLRMGQWMEAVKRRRQTLGADTGTRPRLAGAAQP